MSSYEPMQAGQAVAANYIVYILDGAGKIQRPEWIAAGDDEEALALVAALNFDATCELWQRDRRVGRIDAAGPSSGVAAAGR